MNKARPEQLKAPPQWLEIPPFWIEHIPFVFYLVPRLKPSVIVELGVHSGNSFFAFCQAVKQTNLPTMCYAIDTWLGDKHSGFYKENIYESVLKHQQQNYADNSVLMRITFDKAVNNFKDKSIDILNIDGRHTYPDVKHDFETWLPKLSETGIVLMHDTQVKIKDFGVWKFWEEISKKYPSFEFTHGCGLGVLAVGNNVPEEVIQFIQNTSKTREYRFLFENEGKKVQQVYKRRQTMRRINIILSFHLIIIKKLKLGY